MKKYYTIILLFFVLPGCKKQDKWLDVKSKKSDVILSTVKDYQSILDNANILNNYALSLGIVGADNYSVTTSYWLGATETTTRNAYVWASDIYEGSTTVGIREWTSPYQMVEYANVAAEGLEKTERTTQNLADWNNVKGSALFYRSLAFYNLAQIFAKTYNKVTAGTDLGIPLRQTSDVNVPSVRATVQETYNRIITDLKEAELLLPLNPIYTTRPGKTATYALLAKTYLMMQDYSNAKKYADLVLSQNNTLIDFNTLSTTATYSFPNYQNKNPEVIYYSQCNFYTIMLSTNQIVSTELYNSYGTNDLRKSVFYRSNANGMYFSGKYTGDINFFGGLATNEMYLIRAECNAREGNTAAALTDINTLLIKRWNKNVPYVPYATSDAEQALRFILQERRKELPFTSNTRWEDLRRLNLDPRFAVTISRTVNNVTYSLPPNDPRYVYPIPPIEIEKSGLQQNLR